MRGRVALVLVVGLAACATRHAQAYEPRDPYGPLDPAVIENWARPATPEEQARVEELRKDCRATAAAERTPQAPRPAERTPSGFTCGEKKTCSQMDSCEEAKFYLKHCGRAQLDGDKDGTPCDALCRH